MKTQRKLAGHARWHAKCAGHRSMRRLFVPQTPTQSGQVVSSGRVSASISMGKKGGSKRAVLASQHARGGPALDDEDAVDEPVKGKHEVRPAKAEPAKDGPARAAKPAVAVLDPASGDEEDGSDEGGSEKGDGPETRGKMLQRHKKELRDLKAQLKKMGKKAKDDGKRLEDEMAARHARELQDFDRDNESQERRAAGAEAGVAGLSLYGAGAGEEDHGERKKSKGQRRREKLAEQEAEREARIKEELANLGETKRMMEQRELLGLLAPLGLRMFEIPPDGHCMYRSIEHQIRTSEGKGPGYLELRKMAATFMRDHRDDFLPFAELDDVEDEDEEAAWEKYLRDVADTAAWGGQLELQALAQALGRQITVHSVGMPTLRLGEGPEITVCYLKHAYGLGEHYNSVVAVQKGQGDAEDSGDDEGAEGSED